jgi:hypothetical protein
VYTQQCSDLGVAVIGFTEKTWSLTESSAVRGQSPSHSITWTYHTHTQPHTTDVHVLKEQGTNSYPGSQTSRLHTHRRTEATVTHTPRYLELALIDDIHTQLSQILTHTRLCLYNQYHNTARHSHLHNPSHTQMCTVTHNHCYTQWHYTTLLIQAQ